MNKVLLFRTWCGEFPPWSLHFMRAWDRMRQFGWHVRLVDEIELRQRLTRYLPQVDARQFGFRKCGDFDPAIPALFPDLIQGFEFWGHVGLDVVPGRFERYLPDETLDQLDVFGNDPNAINGAFSIYRNTPVVNDLFRSIPNWAAVLSEPEIQAFDEIHMSEAVRQAHARRDLRFRSEFWQSHDKQAWHMPVPRLRVEENGALIDVPKREVLMGGLVPHQPVFTGAVPGEIMMFHFNRKDIEREWPVYS